VVFYERHAAADEVRAVFASGFGEALVRDVRMPLGHGVSGWAAANGRSVINADTALDLGDRLSHIEPRFRSVLSVPLTTATGSVGAVTLYSSQPNAFRDEQRQAIELVSRPMAEAFERALLADASTNENRDAGDDAAVANGHALHALIENDSELTGRFGRTLGVLCVQNNGSPAIMAHAAVAVSQSTRIADLIFRPNERTFVVLMPDCDPGAGQLIADRVASVMPPGVVPPPSQGSPLRLAFACSPLDGDTVRQLLEVAERRLGEAPGAACGEAAVTCTDAQAMVEGGQPWHR
jgi:hypothetical protein